MAVLGHEGRWLRHKNDGTIYNYNDILCKNPAVEEVSELEAFPEKHIPKAQQGRKTQVDLSTPNTPKDTKKKKKTKPALAQDAGKGLGKAK